MILLLCLHFGIAAVAPILVRTLHRKAFLVLALAPAIAFCWLLTKTSEISDGGVVTEDLGWVPSLHLDIALRLSTLSWTIGLLVTGIGALVLIYCAAYFKSDDPSLWRFSSVLTAFAGAMLGLVLSDNLLLLYVFWELTTVFSYLLIGNNPVRSANRRAAMQALIVTTLGGLAMLIGIVILGQRSSYRISELLATPPPADGMVITAIILLLVGALSKSALIPFHFWLPGAMAAPTPVSAYLHAAAMVKAGVYLVAVFAPMYAEIPGWRPITLGLGVITMIVGGWRALRQEDIKLLLAYGTVSQLGFLVALVGMGTRAAALGGIAMVVAHALFKSTLFMTVGIVDHSAGTRNLRELSGLWRKMPVVFGAAVLAGLSMAAAPPFAGYAAKESAFEAVTHGYPGLGAGYVAALAIGLVLGSALTVAYTARFLWGAFATKRDIPLTNPKQVTAGFAVVPVIVGVLSLIVGFFGGIETDLFAPYVDSFASGAHVDAIGLWHGFTPAFAMTIVAIVLGLAMFWWRAQVESTQKKVPAKIDGERAYNAVMRGLDRSAVEVTAITQRGSLPLYLGTILVVAIVLVGSAAIRSGASPTLRAWDSPAQAGVGIVIVLGAVLAARARGRLKAVVLVGASGYGVAVLFLLHGAPDLALTQLLVETVSLVVFVLVLRRLPEYFASRPMRADRYWRIAIGVVFGALVSVVGVIAADARVATPVSVRFPQEALSYGHGKNIVNVTLVDIRAWDTLGEISVLVVAATGIASLIFIQTRNTALHPRTLTPSAPAPAGTGPTWLRGVGRLRPERRSVIFEVVTRLVFHIMIAFSLFLVFSGHNAPGGGFAGGLVAGLALLVRYLAGGRSELDEAVPIDAGLLLGIGLLISVVSSLAPLLFGGTVLQSTSLDFTLPIYGDVHIVTSLFFDIGVYLIVIGLALDIARSLGAGIDRHVEQERRDQEVATR
ncbi:multisubunit sodium/proton antiporter MrpA subunit /multisubunit sodium/proton antiporter MrpB subunit [Antricoccus suffuscus]|uniref:Multisubunit sodium/proton antiporter MrpA subunit /multisubunit sodium/proton antiporter MrpB subunit n=1 Tax=Antricoccus suffuscus TaxID=1629062 RepID=A0A2T1A334_9ACTN|nr:Na+/H+ antiporter subunit A [Antricoccus suffuscus]PRZ43021.1 multisubunit sodium/proton antiporter MrpA subunit /multisubunit sodium/proton antiporter MrpB subunit [Antricoccus suffuscus]